MSLPSKIASTWFGDKERALATAAGSVAIPIGAVIAFMLPSTVIEQTDFDDLIAGKKHYELYLFIQTIIITLFCIPPLIFLRESPPSPPSVVANETNNRLTIKESLKELVTNRNYIPIFFVFNFIYGIGS